MVECICNPHPKRFAREELILLAKDIELGVSIQEPCRDKLIENSDNKRRKHSENNVEEGERP